VSLIPTAAVTRRRLIVSAIANGLAFIAQLAAAFVLAPLMLRYFGRERYGVWSFVESFLAYFTLFDLGISATLVRYVAKCHAEDDEGLLNRIVSGCLLVFSGAGLLVVAMGVGVFALVMQLTSKVPAELRLEVWDMAVVSIVAMALSLPLSIFPAILDGLGRFAVKSTLRTLFLCLRVAGVFAVIHYQGSLVTLALVFAVSAVAEQLAMALAVRRFLPALNPAPWRTNRDALKMVRGYSIDALLAMLAGRISFKTDAIVIGLCGQLDLIPFFDMPSRLVEYAKNLIRSATTTLTPAVSAMEAKGSQDGIRRLFLTGSRCALYLALPIQLGIILYGGQFLELWLGDAEYRLRGQPVLWILSGTLSVAMLQSVAARVLYGVGQIRRFARLMLLEAGLNLGLSLALFPVFGINGVALGTLIPDLAMCTYIVLGVCMMLGVNDRDFLRHSLLQPLLTTGVLWLIWWRLAELIPPTTRIGFAELVVAGVSIYALLVIALEYGHVRWARARRSITSAASS
jgi:O-antigen/teichoic acid export membrane protein